MSFFPPLLFNYCSIKLTSTLSYCNENCALYFPPKDSLSSAAMLETTQIVVE